MAIKSIFLLISYMVELNYKLTQISTIYGFLFNFNSYMDCVGAKNAPDIKMFN